MNKFLWIALLSWTTLITQAMTDEQDFSDRRTMSLRNSKPAARAVPIFSSYPASAQFSEQENTSDEDYSPRNRTNKKPSKDVKSGNKTAKRKKIGQETEKPEEESLQTIKTTINQSASSLSLEPATSSNFGGGKTQMSIAGGATRSSAIMVPFSTAPFQQPFSISYSQQQPAHGFPPAHLMVQQQAQSQLAYYPNSLTPSFPTAFDPSVAQRYSNIPQPNNNTQFYGYPHLSTPNCAPTTYCMYPSGSGLLETQPLSVLPQFTSGYELPAVAPFPYPSSSAPHPYAPTLPPNPAPVASQHPVQESTELISALNAAFGINPKQQRPCRCGLTTHQRTNHFLCILNPDPRFRIGWYGVIIDNQGNITKIKDPRAAFDLKGIVCNGSGKILYKPANPLLSHLVDPSEHCLI